MAKTDLGELYLDDLRERMRGVKRLGEGALDQLAEGQWHAALSPGGNSAAVLVQHLNGNMHSRWGGLRGGYREGHDGESAERHRDAEFEESHQPPEALWALWEDGWGVFLAALDALTPADLMRPLSIRGEVQSVLAALQRQASHYSGHVYQLVLLVKTLRGEGWQTLSIGRGQSAAYTAKVRATMQTAAPSVSTGQGSLES
ncbi:DUF1572 family protein [Deinococcus sp.]|uniref:DUF1572 family protein n=1 Tax=Deinococcus sp. TaxID=47478 RepID=UPI003CC67246